MNPSSMLSRTARICRSNASFTSSGRGEYVPMRFPTTLLSSGPYIQGLKLVEKPYSMNVALVTPWILWNVWKSIAVLLSFGKLNSPHLMRTCHIVQDIESIWPLGVNLGQKYLKHLLETQ